jgi:hypothetical protein
VTDAEQLGALRRIHERLEAQDIEYWVFGGWAVDFLAEAHEDPVVAARTR